MRQGSKSILIRFISPGTQRLYSQFMCSQHCQWEASYWHLHYPEWSTFRCTFFNEAMIFFFNSLIFDDFYLEGEPYKVVIRNSLKDGEYPTKYLLEWETPKNGGADIDRIEICHRRVCFGCNNQGSDLQQNLPLTTSLCMNYFSFWLWSSENLVHVNLICCFRSNSQENMTQKKPWHIAYSIINYNMCFKMHTIKASITVFLTTGG